ncbi:ABC transporter permease [Paraburkholderia sp. NMBU_R16]|nr:ABC transporter permease [Paraburkholderia sp. NMBU_R16]
MKPSLSGAAVEVRAAGFPFSTGQPRPSPIRSEVARRREVALLSALALLVAMGSFVSPNFLARANLVNVLAATSVLALVVLAESLIVLVGQFDLSLASTFGLAPAVGVMLVMSAGSGGLGWAWPAAALAVVLAVGAMIGWINGLLVVRLRLNAFVATLAMLIVLRGVLAGVTRGGAAFVLPPSVRTLAAASALGLPMSVWFAAASFAAAAFMLRYHRLGRALYAIGGSREAARAAGIRVERIVWGVFVIGGVLAAAGGVAAAGYGGVAAAGYGGAIDASGRGDMIFTVVAAAVVGGISLDGGKGSILGALVGAMLLGVAQNLLTLAHVPSFWVQAIYGALILAALMSTKLTGGDA